MFKFKPTKEWYAMVDAAEEECAFPGFIGHAPDLKLPLVGEILDAVCAKCRVVGTATIVTRDVVHPETGSIREHMLAALCAVCLKETAGDNRLIHR